MIGSSLLEWACTYRIEPVSEVGTGHGYVVRCTFEATSVGEMLRCRFERWADIRTQLRV